MLLRRTSHQPKCPTFSFASPSREGGSGRQRSVAGRANCRRDDQPAGCRVKRYWERDRGLAHIPLGWRRPASDVLSLAAEHGIAVGIAVRWSAEPHPHAPALVVVEQGVLQRDLPLSRIRVQYTGRAIMDRIAVRARALCMACGHPDSIPAHVALHVDGANYIVMLCADCEEIAAVEEFDFWSTLGRLDPLMRDGDDIMDRFDENDDDGGWPYP